MGKFLVKQTQTTVYEYLVEADSETEAKDLVENGDVEVTDSEVTEDEILSVEAQ